ncbi:MAG: hypothetical protein NUV82_03615 [Candidatus Komeilibacteria bacterium]|nr:hypothetical protein [Candidatus Komeilibacteria bacterium]
MGNRFEGKAEEIGPDRRKFEFKDLADAEQYLDWKNVVPLEVRSLVEGAILARDVPPRKTGLPLSDQFLNTLSESLRHKKFTGRAGTDVKIINLLEPLEKVETQAGYLNVFETLTNDSVSWNLKKKIYETQVKIALEWLVEQDLSKLSEKEGDQFQEKQPTKGKEAESLPDDIPPQTENVQSSMESGTEKREGEPAAQFRVTPFFGGYFKQLVFNKFTLNNLKWEKPENIFHEAATEIPELLQSRILRGKIAGNTSLSLPLPYDWTLDRESLQTDAPDGSVEISRNQSGLWYLHIKAAGTFKYQIKIGPRNVLEMTEKLMEAETEGELPKDILKKIEELKKSGLPKMKQKRELAKFIRNHLKYSNSPEAWKNYTAKPAEFFKRVWRGKEADCHVANTLAVRALAEIDKHVNFVGGFMVNEKNKEGEAIMHSGNGHAWLEVWDDMSERSVRLDATPKGDPNVDEEQQEKDLEGETGEGDFGESEDELVSAEEIKKQIKEMREKQGKKEKRRVSQSDLEQSRFAEMAECTPAQAREFLNALERVRMIKDENGHQISDQLMNEWKKIVIERKIETTDYRGPVRMDEGDRLEDPVDAVIDIRSFEFNPGGFEKQEKVEKIETDFGGINIYFSFDLSGSMTEADSASGRRKADVQRDVALLFVDSLMQCAYVSRQQGENSDSLPIKIMVTVASQTGEVRLPLTDKWGPKEQWALYASLNRLAQGGTPTHTTLALIEKSLDKELDDLKRRKVPKGKLPIHYVAEISDGEPNDFDQTEQKHKDLKVKGAFIRSYTIGGTSASEDAADPIQSFSQLPQILGKDIIEKFKKLNPRRIT